LYGTTVASPEFLRRYGAPVRPADLARHNCLRFVDPRGRPVPWWFAEGRAEGRDEAPTPHEVTGNLLVDQGDLLLTAAVAGAGIAQLLDFMVTDLVRDGRLVELLGEFSADGPPIHAVTAPGRSRSANVRAIIELAAAAFARREASPGTRATPRGNPQGNPRGNPRSNPRSNL
jgi:LysR family transcriptional regulator, regulator for bpeEF and oprC